MTPDEVAQLCQRINYRGELAPSLKVLQALHHAWTHAVPFENFDIHLGRWIGLKPEAFFDKIVRRRRGGFCYEQNGLLAELLRTIGFDVAMLGASVINPHGEMGADFAHLCLLVTAEGKRCIADVGFGAWSAWPLSFEPSKVFDFSGEKYRITPAGDRFISERLENVAGWPKGYSFSLVPRTLRDFEPLCRHHQTNPDSIFRKQQLCTRREPGGRSTLTRETFIDTVGDARFEIPIENEEIFAGIIRGRFAMPLSDEEISTLWAARSLIDL
jgi:N-hydroxyarylamine O-acetyltransferase